MLLSSPATTAVVVATAPFLVVAALSVDFAAEYVEAVAHVEHGIGVDAVLLGIATACGIHPALVVGLLTQQIAYTVLRL